MRFSYLTYKAIRFTLQEAFQAMPYLRHYLDRLALPSMYEPIRGLYQARAFVLVAFPDQGRLSVRQGGICLTGIDS